MNCDICDICDRILLTVYHKKTNAINDTSNDFLLFNGPYRDRMGNRWQEVKCVGCGEIHYLPLIKGKVPGDLDPERN